MFVSKKTSLYLLALSLAMAAVVSCRRKVEDRPVFPSAEYYSPTQIKPSDVLSIYGIGLTDSKVYIGGTEVQIISISEDGSKIEVTVPASLSFGKYPVKVVYKDGQEFIFASSVAVAETTTAVRELLIGDFDGGGIRPAITSTNFTNGQWYANPGANSLVAINSSTNGVASSPAGGNYFFAGVPGGGILPNTYGFVATIGTRSELQNDFQTSWPSNFLAYPNVVLDSNQKVIGQYYLNFYLNFNGNPKSQIRVFMGNPDLSKDKRFARTIKPSGTVVPANGWFRVSFPLTQLTDNYGFGTPMTYENFLKLNQIDFDISDTYENTYSDCCTGGVLNCCATAIKDPVQVYVDHVVISQGGPAISVQ